MTDSLTFGLLVFVFAVAFAVVMHALRRIRNPLARSGAFIGLLAALVALSLEMKLALQLLMGEVAAAWVVAVMIWLGCWLLISRRRPVV